MARNALGYEFGNDCLKGRVVCGTVYGDMHLKDLLGSIVRVGYCIPVLFSATWLLLPKKHYNGLINQSIMLSSLKGTMNINGLITYLLT